MSSHCGVPSGKYLLKGTMKVDVNQEYISVIGLVTNPSFRINSAKRIDDNKGGWLVDYTAVGGGLEDSGKLEISLS
jgi:hypothetical protein